MKKEQQKNKGGRPPGPEKLVKIGRHIRENQLPVTAEEIRNALDFYRESINKKSTANETGN